MSFFDQLSCAFVDSDGHRRIMTRVGIFSCPAITDPMEDADFVYLTQPSYNPSALDGTEPTMGDWAGRHTDSALDGGASYGFIVFPARSGLAGYDAPYAGQILQVGGTAPGNADDYKVCQVYDPATATWADLPARLNHERATPPFLVFAGSNGIQCIGGGSDVVEQLVYDLDGVTLIWKDVATIADSGDAVAVTPVGDGNDSFFVLISGSTNAITYKPSIAAIGPYGTLDLSTVLNRFDFVSLVTKPFDSGQNEIFASLGKNTSGDVWNWRYVKITTPDDNRYAVITALASDDSIDHPNQSRPIVSIDYYINYITYNVDTEVWNSSLYNVITNTSEPTAYPILSDIANIKIVARVKDSINGTDYNYLLGHKANGLDALALFTLGDHTVTP
jgi:hypothetical protein